MEDKLILLKRKNPFSYEVHRYEINRDKNLILLIHDLAFAEKIVNSYNSFIELNKLKDVIPINNYTCHVCGHDSCICYIPFI